MIRFGVTAESQSGTADNPAMNEPPDLSSAAWSRDPSRERCVRWLSSLGLYRPEFWSTDIHAISSDYAALIATLRLSEWPTVELPLWTTPDAFAVDDPAMLSLVHFDVIRLGRLFQNFPSVSEQVLCRRLERVL
jgi:hypothetical protein